MRIKYRDFWKGFDSEEFFLDKIIKAYGSDDVSYEVVSVYPSFTRQLISKALSHAGQRVVSKGRLFQNKTQSRALRTIWWSGENKRVPFGDWFDLAISFDQDDYGGRNVTFPLIWQRLLFPDSTDLRRLGVERLEAAELTRPRNANTGTKFACTFINNPEPTRLRALASLSTIGKVDVFGRASNNPVKSKTEVAREYRFVVCYENDLFPGYISEKLLDAYVCGAIPLYWGDLGDDSNINRKALINAKDFSSLGDFTRHIENLSEDEYQAIHREPFLNRVPTADKLIQSIKNL
jgi:hypothetical protein